LSGSARIGRRDVPLSRILVLPDSQFGSEDRRLHRQFIAFISTYQPDRIVHVGDFLDCKAPARWSRDTAEEFAHTLQEEIDRGRAFLHGVRQVFSGPVDIKSGNHDERIEVYLRTKAPALQSLRSLRIEALLGLDQYNVGWHRQPFDVAPGWLICHGHEGSLSRYAGGTAIGLARKLGKSVVTGHTHRAGIISESYGLPGNMKTITGMEVGHAMDMKKAAYLNAGANWQTAFGLLYVDGHRVTPTLVPVHKDGSFTVEGEVFGG